MRTTTLPLWVIALTPALLADNCAPSPYEAGTSVLLAAPVAVLVTLGLFAGLHFMWRRSRPTHALAAKPMLVVAGTSLAMGLVAFAAGGGSGDHLGDWPAVAMLSFGPSYLAVFLLTWRVWLAVRPATAARGALIVATALTIVPALVCLAGAELVPFFFVWIYAGIYGIPPVLLLIAFYIEAGIRAGRVPPTPPTTVSPAPASPAPATPSDSGDPYIPAP